MLPSNATNKNVSWESSDNTVVTVNDSGVIKGIQPGTATITVVTQDGNKTAECQVTVINALKINVTTLKSNKDNLIVAFYDSGKDDAEIDADVKSEISEALEIGIIINRKINTDGSITYESGINIESLQQCKLTGFCNLPTLSDEASKNKGEEDI